MIVLLEVTVAILLIVTIICCCYVRYLSIDNQRLEQGISRISADLEAMKAKQRVYEKKLHRLEEPDYLRIEFPNERKVSK